MNHFDFSLSLHFLSERIISYWLDHLTLTQPHHVLVRECISLLRPNSHFSWFLSLFAVMLFFYLNSMHLFLPSCLFVRLSFQSQTKFTFFSLSRRWSNTHIDLLLRHMKLYRCAFWMLKIWNNMAAGKYETPLWSTCRRNGDEHGWKMNNEFKSNLIFKSAFDDIFSTMHDMTLLQFFHFPIDRISYLSPITIRRNGLKPPNKSRFGRFFHFKLHSYNYQPLNGCERNLQRW